jgi:tetratricopeptide (TPR) repeat protein
MIEDWTTSLKIFSGILEQDSTFLYPHDLHLKIATCHARLGQFLEATEFLQKALTSDSITDNEKLEVLVALAEAWSGLNNEEKLQETYANSLKSGQDIQKVVKVIAWDYFCKKKFELAEESLYKELKKGRSSSELQYILGRTYQARRDFENARLCYSQALSLSPGSFIYWVSAGIMYGEFGQHPDAFECFTKAMNICSENPVIWHNFSVLYSLRDQKLEADLSTQKAKTFGNVEGEGFVHPAFYITENIYAQPFPESKLKGNSELMTALERQITKEVGKIVESQKKVESKTEEKGDIIVPKVASVNRPSQAFTPVNGAQNGFVAPLAVSGFQPPLVPSPVNARNEAGGPAAMFQNAMMNPYMFYQMIYRTCVNMARAAEEAKLNHGGDDQGAKALIEMNTDTARVKREREKEEQGQGDLDDVTKKVVKREE